jgi:hypothetical protein
MGVGVPQEIPTKAGQETGKKHGRLGRRSFAYICILAAGRLLREFEGHEDESGKAFRLALIG